jgi:hypothetical protein
MVSISICLLAPRLVFVGIEAGFYEERKPTSIETRFYGGENGERIYETGDNPVTTVPGC